MIASVGPSFLVLVLGGYLAVCAVSAALIFWAEGKPARIALRSSYVLGPVDPAVLPFSSPTDAPAYLRATHPVGCPDGAAAPKTSRPVLVAARPHLRQVPA